MLVASASKFFFNRHLNDRCFIVASHFVRLLVHLGSVFKVIFFYLVITIYICRMNLKLHKHHHHFLP